jgi:endogenous inhibitor of DNA gyrase (YacG/DUF329 family)
MCRRVCPMCKKETQWKGNLWRPFCSERCKLLDLGSWIGGNYVIPGVRIDAPGVNGNPAVKPKGEG